MSIPENEKEYLNSPLVEKQKMLSKEIEFLKDKVYQLRMKFVKENPDFVAENDIRHSLTLPGAMEHNLLTETLKNKQQEFDDLQDKIVEPILEPFDEQKEYHTIANEKLISTLIKMADKFDTEGKFELAEEVDKTLVSLAARPKAPLKHLEDGTKKNLLVFLHKADNQVKSALNLLQEFFKRLRYFDIDETVDHMNLDRVMVDLQKNEEHLDIATKKFYEMTSGRRPGKTDLEYLSGGDSGSEPIQAAEDFFESQNKKDEPKKNKENENEKICNYCKGKGYRGPLGDTCGHCDGSGLEIEMPPEKYEEYDAKDSNETTSEEKLEHCEQCVEDCSGECYCHDKLDEEDLESFWAKSKDDNVRGRMSPDGVAVTNGTGGEGKKQ